MSMALFSGMECGGEVCDGDGLGSEGTERREMNLRVMRELRPGVMSYQELVEATPKQQMQQAVVNSIQTGFDEAGGRYSTEAGIAASLVEMSMAPGEAGAGRVDAFEARRAMGRANAVGGVARRKLPAAGLSVDREGMGWGTWTQYG